MYGHNGYAYTGYKCVVKTHCHIPLTSLSLSPILSLPSLCYHIYMFYLCHSNIDFRVHWVLRDIGTITKSEKTFKATQYTPCREKQTKQQWCHFTKGNSEKISKPFRRLRNSSQEMPLGSRKLEKIWKTSERIENSSTLRPLGSRYLKKTQEDVTLEKIQQSRIN